MATSRHAEPAPLVDTHCHLTLGDLAAAPDEAWARARDAGVVALVLIGVDPSTSAEAVAFAAERPGLYCAVGVHPNETARVEEGWLDRIAALLDRPKVVALGESGLDFHWQDAPRAVQERSLVLHAELALERGVPLVLHVREAYPRAAELLAPHARRGLRGIVHCFAGEEREVDPFLDWAWPISFSGILTFPKAHNVRGAARRTPLELCLLETDAPWLTPAAERGRPNEPAFLVHTARALGEVKGLSYGEVAAVATVNAARAFGLPELVAGAAPEGSPVSRE